MITIVSGFQRCGSSLMLQMLNAAGVKVFHDAEMGYPSFETALQIHRASDERWLLPLDGHALKWLEPQYAMPPALPHALRIIWMKRDYREQAKSAVKFIRHVGQIPVNGRSRRAFESSYRRDTPKAIRLWQARGPVHVVAFEELITEPARIASEIIEFLGMPLDARPMIRAIRPRPISCLPGFLEVELIAERERGARIA